jgi:hypothetical protein
LLLLLHFLFFPFRTAENNATTENSHGTARYANGAVYTGDFADDARAGWGRLELPGGEAYEGEFAADAMHGARRAVFVLVFLVAAAFCRCFGTVVWLCVVVGVV